MIDPTWESDDGTVKLWLADCLAVLPTLPDGAVDAVVTDPPYGVNLNDGADFEDTDDYWEQVVVPVMRESLRVASGPVFAFGAALCGRLWPYQQLQPQRMLVWAPRFTLSHTQSNGIFYRWHPIWCWRLPKDCKPLWSDVLDVACDGHNWWNHPGTKPVELMKMLVSVSSGVILDPFAGSGSTGVACVRTGRRFWGIEINESYFLIARRRIQEALMQLRLPLDGV